MAKLKISILGKEHELVLEGPLSVGRSPAAGLTLETAGVSREHALFKQTSDGRWAVKDLDSTNGTLVNGQAIKVTRLSHGDQIQFGKDVTVTFDDPPPKKEKKPVVFKSRAEREREAKEAAAYAKRMELKEKAKQKEREILGIAEAQGDTTMQIDTEGKLDSLLSEKEQFDAL
ncbi:MAG: FHA domain-containing protein, partial [Planctomycetota bacterium]|nr:FHA domain-containing protein [Planctomycetota bacterium]